MKTIYTGDNSAKFLIRLADKLCKSFNYYEYEKTRVYYNKTFTLIADLYIKRDSYRIEIIDNDIVS